METVTRKPFQGIINIIRFNWHFYMLAVAFFVLLHIARQFVSEDLHPFIGIAGLLLILSIGISLAVSFYVYDLSGLYKLDWIPFTIPSHSQIININAGFDETSFMLQNKYPSCKITAFDFYDERKHTELSIKRARKVSAVYPGTQTIQTDHIPIPRNTADYIFCVLSAHEIRNSDERTVFFGQLGEALSDRGKIIVVEHLRDLPNFFAYNIGFLHFHSRRAWKRTFKAADLQVQRQIKITPFITAFILQKHGTAS